MILRGPADQQTDQVGEFVNPPILQIIPVCRFADQGDMQMLRFRKVRGSAETCTTAWFAYRSDVQTCKPANRANQDNLQITQIAQPCKAAAIANVQISRSEDVGEPGW